MGIQEQLLCTGVSGAELILLGGERCPIYQKMPLQGRRVSPNVAEGKELTENEPAEQPGHPRASSLQWLILQGRASVCVQEKA